MTEFAPVQLRSVSGGTGKPALRLIPWVPVEQREPSIVVHKAPRPTIPHLPPPVLAPPLPIPKPRWIPVAGIVAGLLLVGGAVGAGLWLMRPPEPPPIVAEERSEKPTVQQSLATENRVALETAKRNVHEAVAPAKPKRTAVPEKPLPPISEHPPGKGLRTEWGYRGENRYNDLIARLREEVWPSDLPMLPPLLPKAIIAVESNFVPWAQSSAGARGLMQLMPHEARSLGLKLHPADERDDPGRNIGAGLVVLANKVRALQDPVKVVNSEWYQARPIHKELERAAKRVQQAFEEGNRPNGEEWWPHFLAAYNGGEGTMILAMSRALEVGRDPLVWENLVAPIGSEQSPLKHAVMKMWGGEVGRKKYREMAAYPARVLDHLARESFSPSSG